LQLGLRAEHRFLIAAAVQGHGLSPHQVRARR
jgi:hypothetical protein